MVCDVCGRPSTASRCPEHEALGGERSVSKPAVGEHADVEGAGEVGPDVEDPGKEGLGEEAARSDALTARERRAAERERRMDQRDRQADVRDDRADMDDAQQADRESEVNEILVAADARDRRANCRDADADRRDEAAALDVMVYGADAERPFLARRQAAKNRRESQQDRTAGHIDRYLLTGVEPDDNAHEVDETEGDETEVDETEVDEEIEHGETDSET